MGNYPKTTHRHPPWPCVPGWTQPVKCVCKAQFRARGGNIWIAMAFSSAVSRRERAGSLTCSRAEHEFQVRHEAMSDFSSVIPLDLARSISVELAITTPVASLRRKRT